MNILNYSLIYEPVKIGLHSDGTYIFLQLFASYFLTKHGNNAIMRANLMLCVPCVGQNSSPLTNFSVHEKFVA